MEKKVTIRQSRDEDGLRYLGASVTPDGQVIIEGQDLGAAVAGFFGEGLTEYEYGFTIQAVDLPSLLDALGEKSDVLSALQRHFQNPNATDPKSFLDAHSIPYEFWSRVGD